MAKYECTVCAYIYDEEKEGRKWEDLPDDWECSVCGSDKSYFKLVEESAPAPAEAPVAASTAAPAPKKKPASGKLICSVCGYIVKDGFHGDVCPACGYPKTAFLPYADKMSPQRRKLLDLHVHNILVHFPQAFSLLMSFLIFLSIFTQGALQFEFLITAEILSIFLPLSVLVSMISGIVDGKNRFKRIDTPVLKRKLAAAIPFLIISVVIFFLFHSSSFELETMTWLLLVLSGFCSLLSLFLGYNGGGLSKAEVPG